MNDETPLVVQLQYRKLGGRLPVFRQERNTGMPNGDRAFRKPSSGSGFGARHR